MWHRTRHPGVMPKRRNCSRSRGEREWKVRYDASAARDAFLEGERERIRRLRDRKKLEISVSPDEFAAFPEASLPSPGALDD